MLHLLCNKSDVKDIYKPAGQLALRKRPPAILGGAIPLPILGGAIPLPILGGAIPLPILGGAIPLTHALVACYIK